MSILKNSRNGFSCTSPEYSPLVRENGLTAESHSVETKPKAEVKKGKSPSSVQGTGSIASASSDHSEISDLESDSGIENSHPSIASPESQLSPLRLSSVQEGNGETGHDAVVSGRDGSCQELPGKSKDVSMELYISCLDDKVKLETLSEEAVCLLQRIPEGFIPLPHQIGGRRHIHNKIGFLRKLGENHILYKPVPQNCPREITFYEDVFKPRPDESGEDYKILKELIPEYYGRYDLVDRAGNTYQYIMLEDMASKFRKPCILDLKVGRRVWDDLAQQEVIDRKKRKYPQQELIGFRIVGMRMYRESTDDYVYFYKEYGLKVDVSDVLESLGKFFSEGDVYRSDVIGPIIEKLRRIRHQMQRQKLYHFFATSVLIVYEGDTKQPTRKPQDLLDVRLVDFAHSFEHHNPRVVGEPDHNTLFGINKLVQYLEQLRIIVK